MRKPRKNYTPVEKVAILRRHLLDRVPVSDLCDEHQLSPTLFYLWQKQFFENGTTAWVPHDTRDAIVDFVWRWSGPTEIPIQRFITWLGVAASKFHNWRTRYG